MRKLFIALLSPLFAAACAGGSQPAAAPEEPSAPAPSAAPAESNPAAEAAPASQSSIDSQREPFIQSCMARSHAPDYCECGFQQFREIFKDEDLSKPIEQGDPRLKALQEKIVSSCTSKLNEEQVKKNFIDACIAGDDRKSAYCNCAWPALRKQLSVSDFIGDADTPRFAEAKKSMVVACKGKLPVEVAKNDFMSGCMRDDPQREKTCTCYWTKIKAKFGAEELAAGTADVNTVPGLKDCAK